LNRKEMIIVGVVLLVTFIGGAYAAPSIQQVLVTNFPSNQHVTVTNPNLNVTVTNPTSTTLQTSAVDIDLYANVPPAIQIWNIPSQTSLPEVNFTTAFAFAPTVGFGRVTSVALTMIYTLSTSTGLPPTNAGVIVVINGQSSGSLILPVLGAVATASGYLSVQGLHPGSNMINIGLPANDVVTLYKAHLTVEYTFLG